MATDKTKSGRAKNYKCPYCDQRCYNIYSLNMHIGARHPGEKTVPLDARKDAQLKPFKPKEPEAAPMKSEPEEPEDQEEDEDDDPY